MAVKVIYTNGDLSDQVFDKGDRFERDTGSSPESWNIFGSDGKLVASLNANTVRSIEYVDTDDKKFPEGLETK